MPEQRLETVICQTFTGDRQIRALEFAAYLRANGMQFEKETGYLENQLYWLIKYQTNSVCYILINGIGPEEPFRPWTIWSDDSDSPWYETVPLKSAQKEMAWKHVDFVKTAGIPVLRKQPKPYSAGPWAMSAGPPCGLSIRMLKC